MMIENTEPAYVNKLIEEKYPVTVFLMCGVKLQGIIIRSDDKALLLQRESHCQLIYKHAISTIMPSASVLPD